MVKTKTRDTRYKTFLNCINESAHQTNVIKNSDLFKLHKQKKKEYNRSQYGTRRLNNK